VTAILVGDADDEPLLALEQLGFYGGKRGVAPLAFKPGRLRLRVALGYLVELAEGMPSVLGVVDVSTEKCTAPKVRWWRSRKDFIGSPSSRGTTGTRKHF
jgi:hypothetical protein